MLRCKIACGTRLVPHATCHCRIMPLPYHGTATCHMPLPYLLDLPLADVFLTHCLAGVFTSAGLEAMTRGQAAAGEGQTMPMRTCFPRRLLTLLTIAMNMSRRMKLSVSPRPPCRGCTVVQYKPARHSMTTEQDQRGRAHETSKADKRGLRHSL